MQVLDPVHRGHHRPRTRLTRPAPDQRRPQRLGAGVGRRGHHTTTHLPLSHQGLKVRHGVGVRGEQHVRQAHHRQPYQLLGKRVAPTARAQARLQVRHPEARPTRHQRSQQRGRRVTVHQAHATPTTEHLVTKAPSRPEPHTQAGAPQRRTHDRVGIVSTPEGHIGRPQAQLGPQAGEERTVLARLDKPECHAPTVQLGKYRGQLDGLGLRAVDDLDQGPARLPLCRGVRLDRHILGTTPGGRAGTHPGP